MSGVHIDAEDDDDAANTARRAAEAATIASALKSSDSWGDEKLQDFTLRLSSHQKDCRAPSYVACLRQTWHTQLRRPRAVHY